MEHIEYSVGREISKKSGLHILFSYGLVGRGGDALQVLALAEAFQTLGHELELIGPNTLEPYGFGGSRGRLRSQLRRLPWWTKDWIELGLQLRLLFRAQRFLKQHTVDLVLHRAGIYDFAGARLTNLARCPLVVHLDAPFTIERAFRGEGHFTRLHRRCMQRLGQVAQLVFTVSETSRDYFVQLGLPAEKIIVLPNGVSTKLLQKGSEMACARPPFSNPQRCTIGFVGSLSRWHRVDLLLEALSLVISESDDTVRLVVVGYGERYTKLCEQAKALGLEDHVSWLGPLPHEEAFEKIAQFDVAVLPHTLPTGAPMKLFEYAALARPTIAPDLPNIRELFSEEEMCFVRPEDSEELAKAILVLRRQPEVACRLGERAREHAQEYAWENIVSQLLEAARSSTQHES